MKEKQIVPAKQIPLIFSNVEQLLPVNVELLQRLTERRRQKFGIIDQIGDIFVSIAQFLKMYQVYCGNQPEAVAYLRSQKGNGELHAFLQVCFVASCYWLANYFGLGFSFVCYALIVEG
jgi:hypothetical protein